MAASISALTAERENLLSSPSGHIVLQNVSKSFGSLNVLEDVSLQVPYGQFVALVGKSGCGKSTLLRMLCGLEDPTDGQILVGGKPLKGHDLDARIMFQDSRLLPWKRVVDNVGLGRPGDWKAEALDALTQVGLADRANDWPGVLSGGQRQRVALARALVSKPKLLLLDEPLGALDALTRISMQRLIERLWTQHGFTVLLVTHDVQEAVGVSDRVIVIDSGKLALDVVVDLPRPRNRATSAYGSLEEVILNQVLGPDEIFRENHTGVA